MTSWCHGWDRCVFSPKVQALEADGSALEGEKKEDEDEVDGKPNIFQPTQKSMSI